MREPFGVGASLPLEQHSAWEPYDKSNWTPRPGEDIAALNRKFKLQTDLLNDYNGYPLQARPPGYPSPRAFFLLLVWALTKPAQPITRRILMFYLLNTPRCTVLLSHTKFVHSAPLHSLSQLEQRRRASSERSVSV
jgi:hypothetical protein